MIIIIIIIIIISDHIYLIPEVLQEWIQFTISFPSNKLQWES